MYDSVIRLIAEAGVAFPEYGNGVSDETIERAERSLGFPLPDSFKWWLSKYGGGQIRSDIMYGLDEHDEGRPDIAKLHLANIADSVCSESEVVFLIGNEEIFYFDVNSWRDGEYSIYLRDSAQAEPILYAMSFHEFLKKRIQEVCGIRSP